MQKKTKIMEPNWKQGIANAALTVILTACATTNAASTVTHFTQLGSPSVTLAAPSATTRPAEPSTPTFTALPTETLAPTVTLEPTPPLITPAPPAPANGFTARESLVSPNGQWTAGTSFEQTASEAEYRVKFVVQRVDDTQTWTIVDNSQSGLGYAQTGLHHWSHDSRYFYYSFWHIPDGGCHDFFPALSAWQRLNVETGTVTDYPLPEGRGHALSPDDSRLAYASAGAPVQLIWRDLATGDEQALRLPLPEPVLETAQAGNIIWSPSGEALIVAAASHNALCSDVRPQFSLWRVNLNPPVVMALVEPGTVLIRPLHWTQAERILVRDWNGLTWWMDTKSGRPTTAPEGETS